MKFLINPYLHFFISLLISQTVSAQTHEVLNIREFSQLNAGKIISEYSEFLALPNVAADPVNLKKNAAFIMKMMTNRGIKNVQLLEASTPEVPPTVYGEVIVPNATQTLVFYAHYDGQPVDPTQWAKGIEAFKPVLFSKAIHQGGIAIPFPTDGKYEDDWQIYARSASDDKAGVGTILNAYEAIIKSGLIPGSNLKFFFEGEEEAGSTHLDEILEKYKTILQSDLWVIADGPIHQSGRKQVVFGVRGNAGLNLTVYASKRPLHSGQYGNWAPNPAMMLARLLSGMKDENGRVTIEGFYDDVIALSPTERIALQQVPSVDEKMKNELGISAVEIPGTSLSEAINLPSLNINGIQSGNVGKMATNQIPATASAVLDLRLVLGNDWQRQQQKVVNHIKNQGFYITENEPTDEERKNYGKIIKVNLKEGYNAQRTTMDLPIVQKLVKALKTTTQEQVVLQPTMGGSLPLYLFEKYLNAKTITVPVVNHDNNQHAENENIRVGNFFDGIETMGSLMLMK